MALSREEFAAAYEALARGLKTPKDVRAAFREQTSLLDRGQRRPIQDLLGVPSPAQPDLRSDPAALDALGEILLELEILTEPEIEKLIASFLSRANRASLPSVPIPPSLTRLEFQWELGRGRDGSVYRGRRAEPPREIAIRLFRPERRPDPECLHKAVEIAEPGLARCLEAGDGYLVMEFADGTSFEALLVERKLSLRRGFELVGKAARTLAPLHARGLAHGSIAPGTLVVARDDSVRITEFAVRPGTPADDTFALGAILYEIATGACPYEGFHARELKPPSRFNPSAAGGPERIICKALARRYPDAGALGADVARYLRNEEIPSEAIPEAPAKKNRLPLAAAGIGLLALAAIAILFAQRGDPQPPKAEGPKTVEPPTTTPKPPPPRREEEPARIAPVKPASEQRKEEIRRKGPIGRDEERELQAAGTDALARGDYDRLIATGEEFLFRGSDRDFAHYWLAIAYLAKQDPARALESIDAAVSRAPEKVEYLRFRLPLLLRRGEAGRALKDVDRLYAKKWAEVNADIRSLDQELGGRTPDPLSRLHRGILLHYKRNFGAAAADFEAAVQAGESKAFYFLGLALAGDERIAEAREAVARFVAAHPDLPAAQEAREFLAGLEKR